jgi:hypothetical protein
MEDLNVLRDELITRISEIFNAIGQPLSDRHKEDLEKLSYEDLVNTYDAVYELHEMSLRTKAIYKVLDEIKLHNQNA